MVSPEPEPEPAAPTLTKKQRGRHKKLRKRALEEKEGCETSGIATLSDWKELVELESEQDVKVGPSVRSRRKNAYGTCQNAEGVDHRDVIFQALQRTNQSKKRTNDELSNTIPSWATLHNIASMQSLAVIELQLEETCDWESVLSRIPILSKQQNDNDALPVTTRWFQGPRPKSITDALMYFYPSPNDSSKKQRKNSVEDENVSQVNLLKPLTLTSKECKKEGYPMINKKGKVEENTNSDQQEFDQALPTLEEAKLVVSRYQVPAILGDEATEETFVATSRQQAITPSRVFALDCEMVQTCAGKELARITLIQLDNVQDGKMTHTVVLDELVKPHRPVLDYVTRYSGITAAMLNPVETRLEQVQAFLVQLLNTDDILVGHSLENDFRATQLIHDCVVDTSVLFRGNNGRKHSLKHLTASLLKRKIQDETSGHCSEEDAVASLELAIRRAQAGPSFRLFETSDNRVHLLECLKHQQDQPVVCIGPSQWLKTHVTRFSTAAHALTCETVEDGNRKALAAWLVNSKRRAKLVWANLVVSGDPKALDLVNQTLADLVERVLPGTLVLVALQSGLERAKAHTAERKARMNPRASLGWTDDDERNWREGSDCSRSGHVLWLGTK